MFEPIPSLTVVWVLIKKQNEFNVNYILKMNGGSARMNNKETKSE